MKYLLAPLLGGTIALSVAACGSAADAPEDPGGEGTVTIADKTFKINKIMLSYDPGEDGFYRIEGDDAARPNEDCLPGLGGGLALYGDLPEGVETIADFNGRELPFEFSGDGDDYNLCFVGSNGLLGVERGTVRFTVMDDRNVSFTFSGSFVLYDGKGGRSASDATASGNGVAHLDPQ